MRITYLTACAIVILIMQAFGHNLPQTDSVLAKNVPQIFAPGVISLENRFECLGNYIKSGSQETGTIPGISFGSHPESDFYVLFF